MNASDFLIEHECSQCGAPIVSEETDRLIQCEYCRVRSYISEKDCFRYIISHNAPEDKEIIYFPYWRFKGTQFSCFADDTRERFSDISYQAIASQYFPKSLGFRTQTLKLRFLSPKTRGIFLKPTVSLKTVSNIVSSENVVENIIRYADSESEIPLLLQEYLNICKEDFNEFLDKRILYQEFILESASIIYAPFYQSEDTLYDAVLNRPNLTPLPPSLRGKGAGGLGEVSENSPLRFGERPGEGSRIRFIPALCPSCGWDLQGERNALALICRNCESVWQAGEHGLIKLPFAAISEKSENAVWLPFWKHEAEVSGIALNSYADFAKLVNLPRAILPEWNEIKFYFQTPAFKVRPQSFTRLSYSMMAFPHQEELIYELPQGRIYPVTLPISASCQSLKIIITGLIRPRKFLEVRFKEFEIRAKKTLLVYVPFQEKHHEFIQPEFQMAFHKNRLM